MPKDSLKDKLDGNELDLSLNNLEVVPVKELAALPRATHLDLSCNLLTVLPDNFCTLTHLVKVDLSKNRLTELPEDFGDLTNLQHLDLLGNQLTTLPESFHKLRKLKWLDLKDNPLEPLLKKNAGDCLDEKQCRACAERVLLYMKEYSEEMDKKRQKAQRQKRQKEAERQAAEEAEAQRKRDAKKAEKDRKKREAQAKKAQKRKVSGGSEDGDQAVEGRGFFSCCIMLFSVFAVLVAMVVGLAVHCGTNLKDQYCKDYYKPVEQRVLAAADQTQKQAVEYYNTASEVSSEVYASASVRAAEMYQSTRKYLSDMLGVIPCL
nr:hypothetical protein BaRGS_002693 [Batillaria attramentaria]